MLHAITLFVPRLFLLLFLYTAAGCHSDTEVAHTLINYQFDRAVIEKLPVYDSLVAVIVENFPLFQKKINEHEAYQAYRYMPASSETDVFTTLPGEVDIEINRYFTKLGKNFIYGFDIFKDSSVKIYIRNFPSETAPVDITENLSYYPAGHKMKDREFPVKDSVLNKYWQYWTRFDKQGIF